MRANEIAAFIGKRILLRKIIYGVIHVTTLREWYIRRVLNKVTRGKKVFVFLDAGTGLGQHAVYISHKFSHADVLGIDVDEKQMQDNQYFAEYTDLKNLNFAQKSLLEIDAVEQFDIILCASVLEHIENDKQVLNSLYQSLNQKGRLIVYVPTSERRVLPSLQRKINKMLMEQNKKYPHEHVRYYSAEELEQKLEHTGFTVIEKTITYGPFGRLSYDIVTSIQYSPVFKYIFPFYFVLVHPFVLLLMWADLKRNNHEGNGLMILAQKSE